MTEHPIPEARPRYVRYVKNYALDCPNTPVMLFGYSTGGIIVMDTLCGNSEGIGPATQPISPQYTGNVFAAIVYGDETWRAGQEYDSTNKSICTNDAVSIYAYPYPYISFPLPNPTTPRLKSASIALLHLQTHSPTTPAPTQHPARHQPAKSAPTAMATTDCAVPTRSAQ